MKTKLLLSVLAIGFIGSAFGQKPSIELTFTAIYFEAYVQLDSINVTNQTQGVDTVLYYPDTVLLLEYGVGIPRGINQGSGFRINQNYPNPVKDLTTIGIYIPKEDNVRIMVTDNQGRQLLASEMNLKRGNHSFRFMPGNGNMVFFTAIWKGVTRSIKIIQSGSDYDKECKLVYSGYDGPGIDVKSQTAIMGFVFEMGDSLSYIGYATTPAGINGSDVTGDVPQSSEAYIFEIIEGIPCPGIPTITYGNQVYKTVQIGDQCWMKENLNIGTMIPPPPPSMTDNGILEKYCYDDDPANCDIFGGLYEWNEIMQYSTIAGAQGICPMSWHIPTDDEWKSLEMYLGMSQSQADSVGFRGTDEAKKMKTTKGWLYSGYGTNSSGFSALPGGFQYANGNVWGLGGSAYWWTSTQYEIIPSRSWYRSFTGNDKSYRYFMEKYASYSVRCLRD